MGQRNKKQSHQLDYLLRSFHLDVIHDSDICSIISYVYIYWLVVSTPLKNMKVSWDDYSQYMGK